MSDGQVFVFGAIAALALFALVDHLWRRSRKQTGWVIVITQNGTENLTTPMQDLNEAVDMLDLEERMHAGCGWNVDRYGGALRAAKGTTVRWIWIRPLGGKT